MGRKAKKEYTKEDSEEEFEEAETENDIEDEDDNVVDADGFRFHLSIRKNGIFTHSEKFTDANVSMFRGMLVPILYYVYTCLSDENHPGCDDCIEFINTYPKIKFLYASI